ncbi:MAG: ComEC/Rec2 family competence protein [Acidimicrobiales bacterium]
MGNVTFAGLGDVYLRNPTTKRKVKQLLWGDFLNVVGTDGDYFEVRWGTQRYLVRRDECQDERPLEVVFVDVGQGDGCLLVTPERPPGEKIVIVDAGEGRNMYNFLKWRFGKLKKDIGFHAAVITHSDQDHYGGFQPCFEQERFSFGKVHHNGLAERAGQHLFGASDTGGQFLTEIVATDAEIRALYANEANRGRKRYPKLIHTALTGGRVGAVEMLSTVHGTLEGGRSWLPGFSPSESPELTIEVLGPVVEPDPQGNPRLRWFGDKPGLTGRGDEAKTKNGHSVLFRLHYRDFSLFFGGDLNLPAEHFLLRHYAGADPADPLGDTVEPARQRFRADVMKSCHHGSADVTDEFLRAVDPFAFTVSSGDQESYVHPRPDLLGRLGRHGRGPAPLILCTEILRSGREREDASVLRRIRRLDGLIENPETPDDVREEHRRARAADQDLLARRNVEVYGAITLRTDGRHLVIAFRLESKAGSGRRWHTYTFRHDPALGFAPAR